MKVFQEQCRQQQQQEALSLNAMVAEVRKPLERNSRQKFNTLLIVDVHARDIVDSFVRDSVLDAR